VDKRTRNGAASDRTRKYRALPERPRGPGASMGPRPIGRGNEVAGVARSSVGPASMGPRPIGRGNPPPTSGGVK